MLLKINYGQHSFDFCRHIYFFSVNLFAYLCIPVESIGTHENTYKFGHDHAHIYTVITH